MKKSLIALCALAIACPAMLRQCVQAQTPARDENLQQIPTVKKLVDSGWKGTFSPGGQKLAYGKEDRSGLVVRDLDSDETTELAEAGKGKDATWSPDGKWIAFVKEAAYDAYSSEEVWLISPDSRTARKLATGGFPQWSADGKRVFFHSRRERAIYSIEVSDERAKPTLLFENAPSYYPAISPDEKFIAFGRSGMLTIVDRKTGETVHSMRTPGARGLLPAWSPDGRLLAYGGFNTDRFGVWVLDMKTKRARRFAKGAYTMPFWAPDGSKLLFDYRAEKCEIWSIDVKAIWELFESDARPVGDSDRN